MVRKPVLCFVVIGLLASAGWAWLNAANSAVEMSQAAEGFLASLSDEQRTRAVMEYDSPQRLGWHFIPLDQRKGLQIRDMNEAQRKTAHTLLRAALSQAGYEKSTTIMELERILHALQRARTPIRDAERYYFTVFGKPGAGRWGLSVEGHHLSLNFVVEGEKVVSSTPAFFGANPATVMGDYEVGPKKGTRVLAAEEELGFMLVNSLTDAQRKVAVIADKAPADIRAGGDPQPPQDPPVGLPASELNEQQVKTLRRLIDEYAAAMPTQVAQARLDAIEKAGFEKVHFAWAGATRAGVGHYYRVQGPTFLIEFVNVQPDGAGNPANHIHCCWRDMRGDFAVEVKK
jgi:uncharacterized protein YdbL (DUF1318 family)